MNDSSSGSSGRPAVLPIHRQSADKSRPVFARSCRYEQSQIIYTHGARAMCQDDSRWKDKSLYFSMGSEGQWVSEVKYVRSRTCGLRGAEISSLTIQTFGLISAVLIRLYVVCAKRRRKYVAGAQGATQDLLLRPSDCTMLLTNSAFFNAFKTRVGRTDIDNAHENDCIHGTRQTNADDVTRSYFSTIRLRCVSCRCWSMLIDFIFFVFNFKFV